MGPHPRQRSLWRPHPGDDGSPLLVGDLVPGGELDALAELEHAFDELHSFGRRSSAARTEQSRTRDDVLKLLFRENSHAVNLPSRFRAGVCQNLTRSLCPRITERTTAKMTTSPFVIY